MTVTVSTKWQMVIPREIRKKYHIEPQTKIEFIDKGKEIVIVPLSKDPVRDSRGILKGIASEDVINLRRQERRRQQEKYKRNYGISS